MKKLNLGCGKDYREGWVNVDFNKEVKADIYCDLEKKLPFKNSEFDYILVDNVLEHVKDHLQLIDEMWRITKNKGIIEVYVPHFTSMYGLKHLTHYKVYGIGSFGPYCLGDSFNGERYGKARFKILKEELHYFHKNLVNLKFLSKLPINGIFNFSKSGKLFFEKFIPLRFDEIFFKLQVIK